MMGKSLVLFFLGSALFASMWTNLESPILLFLAVILGLFTVAVGILSGVMAVVKSVSLDKVRKYFRMDGEAVGQNALSSAYAKHALLQPQLGLTQSEFNKLAEDAKGVAFAASDLPLIFNALSSSPKKDAITLTDLQ